MTGFEDREKGFERKFEHDQELTFQARARRNHMLGIWAAKHLGLSGAAAEEYAKEVIAAGLKPPGDRSVVDKVTADFAAKGVALDARRVRFELNQFYAEAKKQFGLKI